MVIGPNGPEGVYTYFVDPDMFDQEDMSRVPIIFNYTDYCGWYSAAEYELNSWDDVKYFLNPTKNNVQGAMKGPFKTEDEAIEAWYQRPDFMDPMTVAKEGGL